MAAAFALCPLVALLDPTSPAGPLGRAGVLRGAEQDLGLFFEPRLHELAAGVPGLLAVIGVFYLAVHVPATVGALVWVWLERPARFVRARNAFLVTQLLVVCGYVLWPTAPPWMLERPAQAAAAATSAVSVVQSPFAAFPSGHVAFAVLTGATVFGLVQTRWIRAVAAGYPLLVIAVVLATANHFWLDAVGGAICAAAGMAAARAAGGVSGSRVAEIPSPCPLPRSRSVRATSPWP